MTRLALFDLDDTLVDLTSAFARWAREFAADRQLGEGAAEWLVGARGGGPLDQFFRTVRARFGLAETAEQLWESYRARMPELVELYPNTLDDLAALRAAGWRVGIVTNGKQDNQSAKLTRTGLADAVDGFCISDAVGIRKPDPRILHRTAERCGARLTAAAWIIGDSPRLDIAAGHAAGIRTLWISHRRIWAPELPAPHQTATNLREAVRALTAAPAPKATAAPPDRPASAPSRTG